MGFLTRALSFVWDFMTAYAEYKAKCIRQRGYTSFY